MFDETNIEKYMFIMDLLCSFDIANILSFSNNLSNFVHFELGQTLKSFYFWESGSTVRAIN